jgi:SAM-dependent methyltransferase
MNDREVSFNDYVDSYKKEIEKIIRFAGQDVDFYVSLKADLISELAGKYFGDISDLRVLDVGCGIGLVDMYLRNRFRNLYGIDVENKVIKKAGENNPSVSYLMYDGKNIPFEDNFMDITFAVNVIHHVKPEYWQNFINEMARVTRKGGAVMIFEHNPLNPLTLKVVKSCEFDRDAVLLRKGMITRLIENSGLHKADGAYIIFFPFRHRIFRIIERHIGLLPLGAQYFVVGLKPDK